MQLLVDEGLLATMVKAQHKDVEFQWTKTNDKYEWKLSGSTTEPNVDPNPDTDGEGEVTFPEDLGMSVEEALALGFKFDGINTITKYEGPTGDIIIPEKIDGKPVVAIGTGNEKYGYGIFEDKGLTSVSIPSSVTKISKYAFKGNNLTEVILPEGLKTIEEGIFSQNNLKSISIPNSVIKIEKFAFDLNELTDVEIPESVTSIQYHAFYVNKLKKVTIKGTKTKVENYVFTSNLFVGDLYDIPNNSHGLWELSPVGWKKK